MADNVDVTEGSGKTVASDDIQVDGSHGQGQVQFVKLVDGTLNGTGSIRVNQAAKANAITVAPASDISDATYIGDIKFGEALPAGTNAIGKLAANSGVDIGDVTLTAGTAAIGKLAANSGVDIGDVDVTSIVPGVAATNLGKAEDAGHSTGDVGVMALTVRQDTAAALGGTDADYQPLITDASGRLHIAPLVAGSAAIGKLAANTGVDIGDVDVTSVIAGVGATNLGKARDSALGATDTGVMALAVRDDTLTTLTPADGDYVPLRVSSTGQLHVTGAGGGTEYTEDVATANPQVGSAIMVERDDALTTVTPVEADWIGLRGTAEGALWTQDFNSDAMLTALQLIDDTVYIDDADWSDNTSKHLLVGGVYQSSPHTVTDGDVSPFGVDVNGNIVLGTSAKAIGKLVANSGVDIGDVDVTSIVPGVAATNLGKAEDAAHSSGDVGVAAMTVRANTATSLSGSDNDYQPLITDTNGRLHVIDVSGDAIKTAVEIMDDWDATHDSAASADGPQLMAAYDATKPTAVGDADAVRILADAYGRLLAGVEPQAFQAVYDSVDASGEGEAVHASAASTIIVVQSYVISVDAEMWIKLQDEASGALTGKFWLRAGGGVAITLPDKAPIVLGVDKDLEVISEGAGAVSVSVTGYTIPG